MDDSKIEFHGYVYVVRANKPGLCLLEGEVALRSGRMGGGEAILTSLFGMENCTPLAQCRTSKETGLCEIVVGTRVEPIPHPDVTVQRIGEVVAVRPDEDRDDQYGMEGQPFTFGLN